MSEQTLWRAVVLQAFQDSAYVGANRDRIAPRATARAWLTGWSPDFIQVCNLADLNPEQVRTVADGRAARGWPPLPVLLGDEVLSGAVVVQARTGALLDRAENLLLEKAGI